MRKGHDYPDVLLEAAIKASWKKGNIRFWRRLKAVFVVSPWVFAEDICNILEASR